MPNYVVMRRKGEKEAVSFQEIDAEMCAHFGVECHPVNWFGGWYSSIVERLSYMNGYADVRSALIQTRDEAIENGGYSDQEKEEIGEYFSEKLLILDYLEAHFDVDSFYQPK